MTEQEWLACENPREMVLWARRSNGNTASRNFQITDRQYRMYGCACCLLAGTSVEVVNQFEASGFSGSTHGFAEKWYDDRVWRFGLLEVEQDRPEMRVRADLLRCILGNPFKRITKSGHEIYYGDGTHGQDHFITPTVKSIAQRIYDDRDWDAMGVLADALEDAGCNDIAILEHLRGPVCQICEGKWSNVCSACMGSGRKLNRHARGCHVIDLILGKE